jgi:GNAT superfamily N-acetyltransferase
VAALGLLPRAVAMLPTIDRMAIRIEPLTPDRLADLATLFDQGGDPKWCWCAYFRARGRDWTNSTAAANRDLLQAAAREQDHAPGLIAYDEDVVVGWVSLGPREDYERLAFSKVLAPLDDKPVWSIVCFVVGRKSRGQGIAAALLDGAIEYARGHGATILEAYPADLTEGERVPSANVYQGTLGMFERAGFKVVARRQANAAAAVRPIVRKTLRKR